MGPDQPPRDRSDRARRRSARPCRRSGARGQSLGPGRVSGTRALPAAALPYAIVLVGLVALTACQKVDGSAGPASGRDRLDLAGADGTSASSSEYPSLHSVPPRPRLSYDVQQRRTIVDGLVADRELARYTDQLVRYRSGQSSLPPPPAPPRTVAAVDTAGLVEPPPAPEVPPEAAPDERSPYDDDAGFSGFDDDEDDGNLGSFVDDLARDPFEEQADETGVPAADEPAADEPADDEGGVLEWLGGLLGFAEPDGAERAAELMPVPAMQPSPVVAQAVVPPDAAFSDTPPPRPQLKGPGIAVGAQGIAIEGGGAGAVAPGSQSAPVKAATEVDLQAAPRAAEVAAASVPAGHIAFAPNSAELPADAIAQLEQVLAEAKSQGAVIRILGEASVPALALDRARAVGLALVRLGAGASDLEMTLAPGASGDQARLLLAGAGGR